MGVSLLPQDLRHSRQVEKGMSTIRSPDPDVKPEAEHVDVTCVSKMYWSETRFCSVAKASANTLWANCPSEFSHLPQVL